MVELDRLRALSARVGSDPLLVQAAGGNTSLKDDGVMWIKASGTWLKDAAARDIFVPLDHAAILAALAKNDPACESCTSFVRTDLNSTGLRPSIETTVHALMPQRVVVHVHCVNTIAWAIRADGEQRLAEKLKGFDWPDPIAMAVALEPDIASSEAHLRVEVSLGLGHERGQTIVDHLGNTKREPNCRVVYRVDRERFIDMTRRAFRA
mgnify:CR=1 FL=1